MARRSNVRTAIHHHHKQRLKKRRSNKVKLDLTFVIRDLDGHPYPTDKGDMTLGFVLVSSLFFGGEKAAGEERYKRNCLVDRIYGKQSVELDAADLAMVRKLVGESPFNVRVCSLAWDQIDAAKEKPKES